MNICLHVQQLSCLSNFNETRIFSTDFRKILDQILRKSVQWEPNCFMRTYKLMDRQTHRHEEAKSPFAVLQTRLKTNKWTRYNTKGWNMVSRVKLSGGKQTAEILRFNTERCMSEQWSPDSAENCRCCKNHTKSTSFVVAGSLLSLVSVVKTVDCRYPQR